MLLAKHVGCGYTPGVVMPHLPLYGMHSGQRDWAVAFLGRGSSQALVWYHLCFPPYMGYALFDLGDLYQRGWNSLEQSWDNATVSRKRTSRPTKRYNQESWQHSCIDARNMKWAEHINRLRDDRWTSFVTTCGPYLGLKKPHLV